MIVNSIEEKYISALCHPITRFNTCTPLTLMEHRWSTPIETLYEQLTDGQQFAMQGGETIHNSQLVRKGYEIIGRTGLFTEDCKEWRKKPEDEQTFDNFKQFFTAADDDRRKNNATTGSSGYSANAIEQIVHHQINNILHQWMQPDENSTSPPTASTNESANTITIEQIREEIMKINNNNRKNNTRPKARHNLALAFKIVNWTVLNSTA